MEVAFSGGRSAVVRHRLLVQHAVHSDSSPRPVFHPGPFVGRLVGLHRGRFEGGGFRLLRLQRRPRLWHHPTSRDERIDVRPRAAGERRRSDLDSLGEVGKRSELHGLPSAGQWSGTARLPVGPAEPRVEPDSVRKRSSGLRRRIARRVQGQLARVVGNLGCGRLDRQA